VWELRADVHSRWRLFAAFPLTTDRAWRSLRLPIKIEVIR
jgi:hypothetical protein